MDEVKSLRQEADEMRRFDTWRSLNQHLVVAVALHERMLNNDSPKIIQNKYESSTQQENAEETTGGSDERSPSSKKNGCPNLAAKPYATTKMQRTSKSPRQKKQLRRRAVIT